MIGLEERKEYYDVHNYPQVYADVRETWQDPGRAELYHEVLSRVLSPHVVFAEGVEDRIGSEIRNGAQMAIALTHGTMFDPVHIAAMATQNEVFHPIIGKTMIGAKVGLFDTTAIGAVVPDLGAIPIWRKKDVHKKGESEEEKEELEAIRLKAGAEFIDTEIFGMETEGLSMAKHVEGTRNKGDKTKIQKVYDGFGRVVSGVDPSVDILQATVAFYYGRWLNGSKTWLQPTMYVDIPADQRRDDKDFVTANIAASLQETLTLAVANHK
ncbi:MAG: hypothetical protein ACHQT9_00770 [Candidatus Saccharimonadales bacterium]